MPRRLSKLHLSSFAGFRGEQWMAVDYSWRSDGILLTVPGVGQSLANPLAPLAGKSKIIITYAGACTAMFSDADMKAVRKLTGTQYSREYLENKACRVFLSALASFLDGDTASAGATLTAQRDEQIYKKPIEKPLHWRILFAVSFGFMLIMLISHIVHPVE